MPRPPVTPISVSLQENMASTTILPELIPVDSNTSGFCRALDEGLNDLRRCILQEFAEQLKRVSRLENTCGHPAAVLCQPESGINFAPGEDAQGSLLRNNKEVDQEGDHHRLDGMSDLFGTPPREREASMQAAIPSADVTESSPKLTPRTASKLSVPNGEDGRTEGKLRAKTRTLSSNLASFTSSQGDTFSSEGDLPLASNPRSALLCHHWAHFVQLLIKLGKGMFALHPCWVPSIDNPALQSVVETNLIPIGDMIQAADEIMHVWNVVQHKGIQMHFLFRASTITSADGGPQTHRARFVIHPLSNRRVFWCILGLLGIIYDGIMISLGIFDFDSTTGTEAIDWALRIYWLIDIGVSFRTGFYVRSVFVDAPAKVAKNYMMTWLAPDLLAVVPDWIITLLEGSSDIGEYSQTFRYFKAFKILRLARIAKMAVWVWELIDSVNSINLILLVHTAKYSLMVMVWVHVCATCWYGIAKNAEDSWLTKHQIKGVQLPQSYFLSLQWAFAQLQGSTDITGSFSASERAFHSAVLMISIFVLAIFVSNITNNLIQLQTAWDKKARHLRALQDYLHRYRVSPDLAESVRKYCDEKLRIEKKLQLGDDDVTRMLPKSLRRSLLVEVRAQMIKRSSPVFIALRRYLVKTFERVCCDLLSPFFVEPDTIVYHYNEEAHFTYFNVAGQLVYEHVSNRALKNFITHLHTMGFMRKQPSFMRRQSSQTSSFSSRPSEDERRRSNSFFIDTGPVGSNHDRLYLKERLCSKNNVIDTFRLEKCQPICEAVLWTSWVHCGDLTAVSHMAFLTLGSQAFCILVENDRALQKLGIAHAVRFCRFVNQQEPSDLTTSNEVLDCLYRAGEIEGS